MKKLTLFIVCCICVFNVAAQVKKTNASLYPKNKVSITTAGGFELEDAYLVFEDGTPLEGDSNITEINKKIILLLVIKSGWKVVDDKVKLTLSQQIMTDGGATVLQNNDVFGGKGEGKLEDAKYIQVKSVITDITNKTIKYFIVKFKMTDTNGKGTISGSYRFYVKP